MANTLTDLKDVRIAQAALLPWMTELMPLSVFSTNFSPSPSDKGDTVKVPVVGAPTAASDFAGTYMQDIDRRRPPSNSPSTSSPTSSVV